MKRRFFVLLIAVLFLSQSYITFGFETVEVSADYGDKENASELFDEENIELVESSMKFIGGESTESNIEVIDTEDRFWKWIESHPSGGEITLGAKITVTEHINIPLHINTGKYGLTLNGGSISELTITGEGVDTPVLTLIDAGHFRATWDHLLPAYNIMATGRDGEGGTALRVQTDKNGSTSFGESRGLIYSVGRNAVGVSFAHPVTAHFLTVSVEGDGSAAIRAPKGTSIYYSILEASGTGAIVATGGVLLDACKTTGDTSGADVVDRKIAALAGSWLYLPLARGYEADTNGLFSQFSRAALTSFLLSGNESNPPEARPLNAIWDSSTLNAVDTEVLGKTLVSGRLFGPYQGLGLDDGFSLDLTVEVLEADRPYIIAMKFADGSSGSRRSVFFQTSDWAGFKFQPEYGNFILWRSNDEGESWYDFTDSPDISLKSGGVSFDYNEISEPIWFCIQEKNGEFSNIAKIYGYEGETYGAHGGDRTGVDRDGMPGLPAPEKPVDNSDGDTSDSSNGASSDFYAKPGALTVTNRAGSFLPVLETLPEDEPKTAQTTVQTPAEWENDTTVAISGRRLFLMTSSSGEATFIKNDIKLTFAAHALEALYIREEQLFSVTAERLPHGYAISAKLDGEELCGLPCVASLGGTDYEISVSGSFDFAEASVETKAETEEADLPSEWQASILAVSEESVDAGFGHTPEAVREPEATEEASPSGADRPVQLTPDENRIQRASTAMSQPTARPANENGTAGQDEREEMTPALSVVSLVLLVIGCIAGFAVFYPKIRARL